ncbi:DUF1697 domain-containing protein [Marixanthomonas ophiurae]|uniref:DUF1697 domain-containing protein n=1 Tax=Marixanthomonas ophiurae TaxID=387659 RepID=A0A3E1Q9N3_9FLAO|nr:DUF1697 domain-containing protein [Marixanthomonas ophiurae]RFN58849.1 DUF1697 domain-containing protein [Marixanthomonas ophiurae]
MAKHIALLRGINVGRHKKFTKAQQLDMLSDLGYKNTNVYLHTGNWIFEASEKKEKITQKISEAIQTKFGWELPIQVLTPSEIETIFTACPFSEEKKIKSYFVILSEKPSDSLIKEANSIQYPNEEIIILDNCIYFYAAKGYGRTKFNMNTFEKKLNVQATSRNYNTITKIIALAST